MRSQYNSAVRRLTRSALASGFAGARRKMPSVLQLPEPLMAGMSLEKRIPQLGASIGIRMRQSYLEVASISFVRRVIRLIQQNNLRRKYRSEERRVGKECRSR